MDCEALRTFVAIHQSGGFSSAAEALGRSQPAISRRIALLETAVGAPLFERAAGGVTLSSAGRHLLPRAERVLAALRDADDAMRALREKSAGPVSIAAVGTLAGTRLTAVLKRFSEDCPKAELAIRTATSAEVSELVRRGEATVGLRYLEDRSSGLRCEQVASETTRVACAPGHRFAGRRMAGLADLRDERWFAFPNAFDQRETFADNLFAQFQARGIGAIDWSPVDSLTAQKRLIEAGLGLALMPDNAMDEELRRGSLATIEVDDLQVANPVYMVVREGGYLSPAADRLLTLLRSEPDLARPLGDRAQQR